LTSYTPDGYVTISRTWNTGDIITLNFSMEVRQVRADKRVEENGDKLALEYGPLVYAVEETDNTNIDVLTITKDEAFRAAKRDDVLKGVNVVTVEGGKNDLTAIPYYAWSNRGIGKMKVWLPAER
jgi:hypothetical protein